MKYRKDLTNNRYGFWLVKEFDQEKSNMTNRAYWKCKCECGKEQSVLGQNLTNGHSKSCGCQSKNMKKKDLTGQIFGYLTVIEDTGKVSEHRNIIWKCKCKCGNTIEIPGSYLTKGTQSCGCLSLEKSTKNIVGKRFGRLVVLEKTDERRRGYVIWKCKCDCGNICFIDSYCLNNGKTNSCGCLNSKGEALIKNILDENNICYNQQYTFPELRSESGSLLRFDFAIFNKDGSLKHLIEYNGQQHYECSEQWWNTQENFNILQNNDKKKIEYCKNNNIELRIIPYTDYNNITLERLI